ncbi:hypothetical protein JMJ77_0005012 [Colletotrichum scovillei]|uniref:Uncharacterized protein n=1 Tax=Colletotrichum scovillei TaxID=1209932 RepID=A0A9P7RHH5_9PEZI|nr:hypothetical protein JMJ77_0005012 [Colletotrichum scovillei]KAG7076226.1 hypothetical protein JMJ76_0013492 [Colletotrichum scovillei]KAG7083458.1 hypothetical protein JMJ78_0008903 [Colletotrichum scovillei]
MTACWVGWRKLNVTSRLVLSDRGTCLCANFEVALEQERRKKLRSWKLGVLGLRIGDEACERCVGWVARRHKR